ncbi:tRNA lysidine(34) synthetase TilS [Sphingomonas ginkgonis]|uniref:tRNA(Ile)-lysidine synthase n=1 Tax=Sphingomonas ginkgonis TaxID=2315330 RepID=A0A429VDU9_9SPHN|nr:tRNA lysidine(34) synthetase TilS [Sphingomonas ginkgonis]
MWGEGPAALLASDAVRRFEADLNALLPLGAAFGLAVSGGPDSVALLLLAAAARPEGCLVATVDHDLRPESAVEALLVERLCAALELPHETLKLRWAEPPLSALQEQARAARYAALGDWAVANGLGAVLTGHHRDDQAETMLMRLSRGSGVRGLAAMRADAPLPGGSGIRLIRPLLDWSRAELGEICAVAGVEPCHDPGNDNAQFERVRFRQALAMLDLDPAALARSARALEDADRALEWVADELWVARVRPDEHGGLVLKVADLPAELRRRLVTRAVAELDPAGVPLRGRECDELLDRLAAGTSASVRSLIARGGPQWAFLPAPPRQPRKPG